MRFQKQFPGFGLRLTRWGAVYLGAVVVLGMAAVNTGNNALMAMLGLALGSYVVAGWWSRQVLAVVDVEARVPRQVYAGRGVPVVVEVGNRSRFLPAYGIVLRDDMDRVLLVESLVEAGATRRREVTLSLDRRGWQQLGPWRLEVLLPLGFFVKSKRVVEARRVLVFPRLLPSTSLDATPRGQRRANEGQHGRGREGDVRQLRSFRDGDERRQLHWKQTARQQRLIVVDRQRWSHEPLYLVLDPRVRDRDDPRVLEAFELLVSEVATAVVERLRSRLAVGLVVGERVVPPIGEITRVGALLRPLAEVQPQAFDAAPPPDPQQLATVPFRLPLSA